MSLRQYDNSNSPRLVTLINDGQLTLPQDPTGERVVVLGFSNNPDLPVQELFPATPGLLNTNEMVNAVYNLDDVGNPSPSELSVALEELFAAGATNVQVINLGLDKRMRDVTGRQARERYIALENAYDLIVDLPVDRLYPVNVVAGLKGDGLYNSNLDGLETGKGTEVIYDIEAFAAAASTEKNLSSVPGFVKIVDELSNPDEAFDKSPIAGGEDLVYQLASVCHRITSNGTFCTGVVRTLTAMELKYMTKIDLTSSAAPSVFYSGTDADGIIAANTWAIAKGYNDATVGGVDYSVTGGINAEDVLIGIETISQLDEPTTGGIKAIYKQAASQTFAATAVSALEEAGWQTFFGVPSTSYTQKFLRFLNSFGETVPDSSLQEGGSSILSYLELDGVTSADGELPDNFLFYATSDAEKPVSVTSTNILTDENQKRVDVGYLLDVVVSSGAIVANFPGTSLNPITFRNVAGLGQIVGWYSTIPSNRATTKLVSNIIGSVGTISSKAASDLTRNRYQLFLNEDGAYTFNRDITMGIFVNNTLRTDFINRFTSRIVKDALDVARNEGKKLLGTINSSRTREGLKQRLEQEYTKWANPEDGRLRRPATVQVLSSGVGSVIGQVNVILGLAVADEILEIRTVASLEQ
jgi:hypothetical protein